MSLVEVLNKHSGYIPLWRDGWEDWDWYYDDVVKNVFFYCYKRASYKDRSYQGVLLKKGSFVTSRSQLARELAISEQKIRTALNKLKSTNDIEVVSSRKGTIISIKNYDWLVDVRGTANQQLTNDQPTTNQQLTTNNKDKKDNKGKNVDVVGAEAPTDYTDNFLRFYETYPKKGYKKDTFNYWCENGFEDVDIDELLKAVGRYEEVHKEDGVKYMCYPRSFLMDDKWKTYTRKSDDELRQEEKMKEHQAQVEYYKSIGLIRDDEDEN